MNTATEFHDMKQVQFVSFLALLMVQFSACTKKTEVVNTPIPENESGFVQLIHACPALPGIKLWQGDTPLQAVGNYYKSNTHYIPVDAGANTLNIKRSANNLLLASYANQIRPKTYYSLFATCDSLYNFIPLLLQDNPLPDEAFKAQLRIVNILSRYESIQVSMNDKPGEQLDARQASPYQYYTPGQYTISAKHSKDNTYILKNILVSLDAGRNYTLYINGFSNKTGALGPDAILMVNH